MSWWGKVLGGTFGFMLGGPIGAILGAALGHNFDKGLENASQDYIHSTVDAERIQSAFFAATFSVMGHIAKADGRVSEIEIKMADQVMSQMMLNAEQRRIAIRLFDQGKRYDFDLDGVLAQFKTECHNRHHLVQMFIEIQIATLLADGVVHQKEREIINYIGAKLGISVNTISQLISMVQAQYYYRTDTKSQKSSASDLSQAYALLGINESSSDGEIKNAYRRLMNQHHPDKLVSKGLPDEMIAIATEKTQEIRKAYDVIKAHRKIT